MWFPPALARQGGRSVSVVPSGRVQVMAVGFALVGVAVARLAVVVVGAEAGEVVEGRGVRAGPVTGVVDLAHGEVAGRSFAASAAADEHGGLVQCVGGAAGVGDGADVGAVADDDAQEGVAEQVAGDMEGNGADAGDLTELVGLDAVSSE